MSGSVDYYKILGVSKKASLEELKHRFRQLALRYHPDRNPHNPQATERFRLVAEAYHALSDRRRRQVYDREGAAGLRRQGFSGFRTTREIFALYAAELFDFLGLQAASSGRVPVGGADLRLEILVTAEEAATGSQRMFSFPRMQTCNSCSGSGRTRLRERRVCFWCQGSGQNRGRSSIFASLAVCPSCNGEGMARVAPCNSCQGQGRRLVNQTIGVRIPPGVEDGTRLTIVGAGDGGDFGGKPGDLHLIVRLAASGEAVG